LAAFSRRVEYSQHFNVPPSEAFAWCTDYDPGDHARMGLNGRRRFTRLAEDTVLLDDTVYRGNKPVRKTKLVKTDAKRMTYYNVHLTGPTRNSLYLYQIVPDGNGESRLDYTGYEVTYPNKRPTEKQLAQMDEVDAANWHRQWGSLARAMERELRG
jgi:hypothetical protein